MSSERAAVPAAERAISRLAEICADLRTCAITDRGALLAATSDGDWAPGLEALWEAARSTPGTIPTQVHVGTPQGEVFAVRSGRLSVVAVTDRFTLESLVFCDLRAALRELDSEVPQDELA